MAGLITFCILVLLVFFIFVLPGFCAIGAREVGILTRRNFGKRLPEGQIIALKGEVGIQADVLPPGFYWRFPLFWKIKKEKIIVVNPGEIGLVKSIDGKVLPQGRLLGDEVKCDSFQNAIAFLKDGYRGPQIGFLRPGTYRINTAAFDVVVQPATEVKENKIGVVVALDGTPLPNGYFIAPRPVKENKPVTDAKFFQNGQEFIDCKGYRGPQLDVLLPGSYYINTLLFEVKIYDIADVPPGYVAVIRSNVGEELERAAPSTPKDGGKGGDIHATAEQLLVTDKNQRGIWMEPIAPGKYPLNPLAYTPYLVPTSAVTIDWAAEGRIGTDIKGMEAADVLYKFNPLKVTSMDGFQLGVNVRMVLRIQPAYASFVIQRFGSIANLIDQIVHPLIDSSFRNKAGEKKAIDFFQSRTALQKEALDHAKDKFSEYNVEAQNLLIAYIDIPDNLLLTQTEKEIALQQQDQYREQSKAEEKRITREEKAARANKQKDVIDAKLAIDIKTDYATARKKEAEGEAAYLEQTNAAAGIGLAKGYEEQKKALGESGTAIVNIYKSLADKGIPIVPITQVGGDGGFGGMLGTLTAKLAKDISEKKATLNKPTLNK